MQLILLRIVEAMFFPKGLANIDIRSAEEMSDDNSGFESHRNLASGINDQASMARGHISTFNILQRFVTQVRSDGHNAEMANMLQTELKKHIEGEVRSRFERIARDRDLQSEMASQTMIMEVGAEIQRRANEISIEYAEKMNDLIIRFVDSNAKFFDDLKKRKAAGNLTEEMFNRMVSAKEDTLLRLFEDQSKALDKIVVSRAEKVVNLLTR